MQLLRWIGCFFVLLSLCGCTWISSKDTNNQEGLAYYLPMKYVEVSYEQKKPVTLATATASYTKARQDLATARTAHATLKAEIQQLELTIAEFIKASIPPGEKVYKDAVVEKATKSAELVSVSSAVATAQTAMRKAEATLTSAEVADAQNSLCIESIQVKTLSAVADQDHRYVLRTQHAPTRTESAKLITTTSGLLSSVDAEATDQLSVAIVDLAKAAAGIRGFALMPNRVQAAQCNEVKISQVIDPVEANAWASLSQDIQAAASTTISVNLASVVSKPVRVNVNGIAYRRNLPLLLEVKRGASTIEQLVVQVPNHSRTESYDASVGLFGKTDLDLKFDNGILVETNETKVSEVAAVAKLPFDVINAFGESVSKVIQFRIDHTTKEAELSGKELELIEANEALLEAQQRSIEESNDE